MATRRKQNKVYYFTVEGNTESLYLKWLETELNKYQDRVRIIIHSSIDQRPFHYAKTISALTVPEVIHMCDVEGNSEEDLKKFYSVLEQMKKAGRTKKIKYRLAYSNLDFELWMILHKADANSTVFNKQQYLRMINRAYGTSFVSLDEYKERDNFEHILERLSIHDVMNACIRADTIMKARETGSSLKQFGGFTFYLDNPSTSVHECIRKIIKAAEIQKVLK